VVVQVAKLTTIEKNIIHAGMSAQIKIALSQGKKIKISLKAVTIKKGVSSVMLMKNGKATLITVQTGNTSLNQVEILTGLNAGDEIVLSN
jgi:hypothetical protein